MKVTERSNHPFWLPTIIELKELNWSCKHMKKFRSSQPCISINFCTGSSSPKWVSLNSLAKHDPIYSYRLLPEQLIKSVLQNSENSYSENFKSHEKVMEFFFSKVAGYNLTKKGLYQRFFHMKFVKHFWTVFLLGQFLVNDSVSFMPSSNFNSVFNAVPVFHLLHFDSCICATLSKE